MTVHVLVDVGAALLLLLALLITCAALSDLGPHR